MLFNYLLDFLPLTLCFANPTMPVGGLPASPMNSADAERKRMDASDAAMKAATLGGRSSTISGGNTIAYAKRQGGRAGSDLMSTGSSRDMGL